MGVERGIAFEIWPIRVACQRLNLGPQTLQRDFGDLFRRQHQTKVLSSIDAWERYEALYPLWDES